MKFDVEKMKSISRSLNAEEKREIEYREENREWLALSAKFALAVRKILRSKQISQTELAMRMGVSSSQITKILSGKENLGLQTMSKVEKALGEKIVDFDIDRDKEIEVKGNSTFNQYFSFYVFEPRNRKDNITADDTVSIFAHNKLLI